MPNRECTGVGWLIYHFGLWHMASVTPDLRLSSQPQDITACDQYQISAWCVWTTCVRLLPDSGTAGSLTRDHWVQRPNHHQLARREI